MFIDSVNFSEEKAITIALGNENDTRNSVLWVEEYLFLKLIDLYGEKSFINFNDFFQAK